MNIKYLHNLPHKDVTLFNFTQQEMNELQILIANKQQGSKDHYRYWNRAGIYYRVFVEFVDRLIWFWYNRTELRDKLSLSDVYEVEQ